MKHSTNQSDRCSITTVLNLEKVIR